MPGPNWTQLVGFGEGREGGAVATLATRLMGQLTAVTQERVEQAATAIVAAKRRGGRVVVATGSGPNLHEGVTTLVAELIRLGVIDGVLTSSAVVAHEMAGTLDRVRRVSGAALGLPGHLLPREGVFEITVMTPPALEAVTAEVPVDRELYARAAALPGAVIIKAAGNMGYPMGLRTERLARECLPLAQAVGEPLEALVGPGCHPLTMLGAGARRGIPVMVTIPQLIGGGMVGTAIGDSIPVGQRAARNARMLAESDVIIESAVAYTQEIHGGGFDLYLGHGLWTAWEGLPACRLEGKVLIRIDLDPQLEQAWRMEREAGTVQRAIDEGLPKAKVTGLPFRMEMSGFARLDASMPIVGDIGAVWPILAETVTEALGLSLEFQCAPQETPEGQQMRDWIVEHVTPVDRALVYAAVRDRWGQALVRSEA